MFISLTLYKANAEPFVNSPTLVLTLLVKFAGKSQSFFDHEDLERIGEDGIYGANAPEIDSPQSQVTYIDRVRLNHQTLKAL